VTVHWLWKADDDGYDDDAEDEDEKAEDIRADSVSASLGFHFPDENKIITEGTTHLALHTRQALP
jgi:hypothetical protein